MTDEFTEHILKIIIAKAALQNDFSSMSETALNIMVDATVDFIKRISTEVTKITTHCGRIDSNGYDMFYGLQHVSRDTPETLAKYLNNPKQIPPFEYYIHPYPLASNQPTSNQHTGNRDDKNQKVQPFRIFVPFRGGEANMSHVPESYPSFPEKYTFDQGPRLEQSVDETALEKQRSKDQRNLQEQIELISKNSTTKSQQAVKFESALTKLMSEELVRQPVLGLLDSPIYVLDGERPDVDPENLPRKDILEKDVQGSNDLSKDQKGQLKVLNIQHLKDEPGKQSDATKSQGNQMSDKGD